MDIWDRFLSAREVLDFYTSCEPIQGNIFAWSDFKNRVKGNIKVDDLSIKRNFFSIYHAFFLFS